MSIRNIIWDFDGTLYDTYGSIVDAFVRTAEEAYGVVVRPERILELVRIDTKYCAQALADEFDLDFDDVLQRARNVYREIDPLEQKPFPGVRECCERVIEGGGQNVIVTHRERASLFVMLEHYNFTSLFTDIIASDDGFAFKPSPESFNEIILRNDLQRDETCGVGDRDLDIQAANAAGVMSVYFHPDGECHSEASVNISAMQQLLDLLGR